MRIAQLLILLFILLVTGSCNKPNEPAYPYEARVIGVNTDCGIYAIRFLSDLDQIQAKFGNSAVQGYYIGKNLPVELQQKDLVIQLDCRIPEPDELSACSAFGPAYGWVYITDARTK